MQVAKCQYFQIVENIENSVAHAECFLVLVPHPEWLSLLSLVGYGSSEIAAFTFPV